jgi:hypothetical protein
MANSKSEVRSLKSLLGLKLKIPKYQRPYRWGTNQIESLLSDIWENKKMKKDIPYMVGTVILHVDNEDNNIVDGQQRLTTLTLILYALGKDGDEMSLLNESFSPGIIKKNYKYIDDWLNNNEIDRADFEKYILDKITFVIITTKDKDEAFVFFDSQNSRGKSLEQKDLLKAHHLRCVANDNIATESAKKWEKLDKKEKLTYLIGNILGRSRQRIRKEKEKSIDVLQEFRAQRVQSFSKKQDSSYKLSRYHQPPIFDSWGPDDNGNWKLVFRDISPQQETGCLKITGDSEKFLPLQLMQPLEGGEQFFWYVQKYNILLNEELFNENFESSVLSGTIIEIYKRINDAANRSSGMRYIKDVFEASLLFYYDKFGEEDLEKFGLWLEHALLYLRYRQYLIKEATIRNYIIDEFNPFAIINEAAFPENCIYRMDDFIRGKYKKIDDDNYKRGIRKLYHEELKCIVKNNKDVFEKADLKDKNRFKELWRQE